MATPKIPGAAAAKAGTVTTVTIIPGGSVTEPPAIPGAFVANKPAAQGPGGNVAGQDAGFPQAGLTVPWYSDLFGKVKRRSQLVLLPTKVEQVTPKPRIAGGTNLDSQVPVGVKEGILAESYTGKSRDQAATVHGSIYTFIGTVFWNPRGSDAAPDLNTNLAERVFVKFQIITHESGEQLIVFDQPVYRVNFGGSGGNYYGEPYLILETACMLLDPDTDAPIRWEYGMDMGGASGVEWYEHPDIQVGVVGLYDDDPLAPPNSAKHDNLIGWKFADGDLEYAIPASQSYLAAHAARYQLVSGKTRNYPFVLAWEPDAATQQITWTMGREGASTEVSVNSEHSAVVLNYPQRRRDELLQPNKQAAAQNMREKAWRDSIVPQAPGRVN